LVTFPLPVLSCALMLVFLLAVVATLTFGAGPAMCPVTCGVTKGAAEYEVIFPVVGLLEESRKT
jgi:hypothetical protein